MFTKKELSRLIIPLLIEQVLAVTVGFADSLMVSGVGESAVSGVSLVDTVNVLLFGLFGALATGGAVVTSQLLGQKNEKEACKSGQQLLISILALSLLLMAISLLFGKDLLLLLFGSVEADVMEHSKIYLIYTAISFPFMAVYNACAALFRSMGNSRVSMIISMIMNAINISFNAILIYGAGWGVAGAAIATLISRIFAAVTMYILLHDKKHSIHIEGYAQFIPDFKLIKRILKIGVPNGLENSVFQIGKILVQGIIAGLGTPAITANAIASTIGGIGVLPGSAIGLALITVVGRCVGARDFDGVKKYTFKLMKLTHIIMAVINALLILAIPLILRMYKLSDETSQIARSLMTYHCVLSVLIWPLSFTLPNALRAANDVRFTMYVSMASMWIWRIAFSYILAIPFGLGVLGVWIAMTIDWLCRSICFVWRFVKGKYRELSLI